MISTRWLDQRTRYWRRLDALLEGARSGGLSALSRAELQELGLLYRQTASDLAAVREDPASARFAVYLNQLLARAHHTIYTAERPPVAGIVTFALETFPRAIRKNFGHLLWATALFLAAGMLGSALTLHDPGFTSKVLPDRVLDHIARREMWTDSIVTIRPLASSAIMTNNIGVSLTAFAAGISGGLGTAYMMLLNGLLLGVAATACAQAGMSIPFWSFVAPHASLELPSILIAGAAGFRLAQGLLFPGLSPRREALARAGRDALELVGGCVPLLVVAGLIEAFVSPTDLAVPLKFGLSASLSVLLVTYLTLAGRSIRRVDATADFVA